MEALEGLREEFTESWHLLREASEKEKLYQERVLRLMEQRNVPRRDREAPQTGAEPSRRAEEN